MALQLGVDRKFPMSRAPGLIRERRETLLIISGHLTRNYSGFQTDKGSENLNAIHDGTTKKYHAFIASVASTDIERDEGRKIQLSKDRENNLTS